MRHFTTPLNTRTAAALFIAGTGAGRLVRARAVDCATAASEHDRVRRLNGLPQGHSSTPRRISLRSTTLESLT